MIGCKTFLPLLIQEEYIKWKGSLFFRFMVALVDPVPAIARYINHSHG